MKLSQKSYYTPVFCPLPWSGEETDGRRKQSGSGWSLHYSCSCNGPKLSPYGKSDHAASQSVKLAIIKTQTTSTHLIWQSEAASLPVCSTHSALCCIYATRHTCTCTSTCTFRHNIKCILLFLCQQPLFFLHHHIPLMSLSFTPLFVPPLFHWAFEVLPLFISPPLPTSKGWSVTERVVCFIIILQRSGDKGQLKCHNIYIFFLCADANAWKETDIQSSSLKSWNTVGDGWRQTRRMRMKRRRSKGLFLCNWLS